MVNQFCIESRLRLLEAPPPPLPVPPPVYETAAQHVRICADCLRDFSVPLRRALEDPRQAGGDWSPESLSLVGIPSDISAPDLRERFRFFQQWYLGDSERRTVLDR